MGDTPALRLLTELPEGQLARLYGFTDERLAARLLAMGILPGTQVQVIRHTLGGTCYVVADKKTLALRKNEAACMQVN
jgi:Fe2+ transport system protein FeoA